MDILEKVKLSKKLNSHEKKDEIIKIMKNLQKLREAWKNDQEINQVIIDLKLPLWVHLFITWKYSWLMSLQYK